MKSAFVSGFSFSLTLSHLLSQCAFIVKERCAVASFGRGLKRYGILGPVYVFNIKP
ncbi:MAG: hypothetical protein QXK89_10895 [Candidatus Bathyarchaeia archaeon]